MKKNLIDYDSILSNQRELVYKQRDQILKNSTNLQIAKNMAKVVAKDVVDMFKSSKNPLFVKGEELANAINKRMFNYSLVSPSFFENKTAAESTNILFNILCISIDKRVELLTPEVANKIFRDIIIQSLDHQ
jgi:preprotein translocase subunit SecA